MKGTRKNELDVVVVDIKREVMFCSSTGLVYGNTTKTTTTDSTPAILLRIFAAMLLLLS